MKTTKRMILALTLMLSASCSSPMKENQEQEITVLADTVATKMEAPTSLPESVDEDFNGKYLNGREEALVITNFKEGVGFNYRYNSGKNSYSCSGITLEGKMKFKSKNKAIDETTVDSGYPRTIEFKNNKLSFTLAADDDIYVGMDCLQEFDDEFKR